MARKKQYRIRNWVEYNKGLKSGIRGLKNWKIKNNYHRRSLSETAFSRLKKIFGASASGRRFESQVTELALRCHRLNKMNQLGMPDSIRK